VLDTDSGIYGGFDRIDHSIDYISFPEGERVTVASPFTLKLYLPSRTAVILEELPPRRITGNPS
jgi:hypothetical protein